MIPLITMIHAHGHSGHLDTPMITSPAAIAVRNSQESQTPHTNPSVATRSRRPPATHLPCTPSRTKATTRLIATNAAKATTVYGGRVFRPRG
jgi:hypothetical protein